MQPLDLALRRLQELDALVEQYVPLMFGSTDRGRMLGDQIAEAYGAVEDVYCHYAGEQKVVVDEGRHKNEYRTYFEAGYLSGRSFHAHQGARELKKVIGRVAADLKVASGVVTLAGPLDGAWSLLHPSVRNVALERFRSGHFADAVESALKELALAVRHLVQQRGGNELDGTALMQTAFSPKNPVIVLADLSTQSGRDMQRGYMDMFSGVMSAVRNPKAHGNVIITRERALHFLFVASTLWYTLDERP